MTKTGVEPEQVYGWLGEYESLYVEENDNPSSYARRRSLQERIAVTIRDNIDSPAVASLVDSLGIGPLHSIKNSKLPHVVEAITASREINKIASEISAELAPFSMAVLQIGSANWGAFYSTRSNSDVDLEVVADDFSPIANLPIFRPLQNEIARDLQTNFGTDFDLFFLKLVFRDKKVVLHLIRPGVFEKLMSGNLCELPTQRLGYREIKRDFSNSLEYTNRCSFTDDRRTWMASHKDCGNGWHLVEKPVYQIENDIFYNGIFPEWHITPLVVSGGWGDWVRSQRQKLFLELVRRMMYEEKKSKVKMRFSNILERKQRMPEQLLGEIDREADGIRLRLLVNS